MPAYLYALTGIDVYTFTFSHEYDLEGSEPLYFDKFVFGQSFFDDVEENFCEVLGIFFRDTFFFGDGIGQFL